MTSLLCMMLLFVFNCGLHAQIVYTDIPDATPNATYPLDLNNDNVVDFLIQFDLVDKLMCKPQNNNAYSGDFIGGINLPWALSASNSICDSLATWYDTNNPGTMALGTSVGNWVGATNKYLALKLIVGSNTHYGWARIDVLPSSTSFTIKDYAYESSPNACIQAGQTSLGINENSTHADFSIFPNPFNASTTIQTTGHFNHATLTIYNTHGRTVKQLSSISGQTILFSRDDLPSGLYFIGLTEEKNIMAVEKLIISD